MKTWARVWGATGLERRLEIILRIGVAGCFIGHGAFGIIGKEAWLPYFAVAGIGEEAAWILMPLVGAVDVAVGIAALLSPRPPVLVYAAGWAFCTALLRPLAGEGVLEALERAGNYGVPLALLVLAGAWWKGGRSWLAPLEIRRLTPERGRRVALVLRATTVLLLVGHGGLALLGKPLLVEHVTALGLPEGAVRAMGVVDVGLAGAVALGSLDGVLLPVVLWKVATEALFPWTGAPAWEFVERAGSYAAPLALWTLVRNGRPLLVRDPGRAPASGGVAARGAWTAGVGALLLTGAVAPAGRGGAFLAAAGPAGVASGAVEAAPRPASDVARSAARSAASPDTTLLARLRAGGLVLACRHAITDRSRGDRRPVDLEDRSTQRVLSPDGEEQARRLGEALRRLDIPVGRVVASPYFRTRDSAELTFGRVETDRGLMYGNAPEQRRARRELFRTAPEPGVNRALVTHQGILYDMLPDVRRGSIDEGDCVVALPAGGDGPEALALLSPGEWEGLR